MKTMTIKIEMNNTIQLPAQMIKQLQLQEGDDIVIEYDPQNLARRCFVIQEDSEDRMTKEDYFCIPMRLFKSAGLINQDLQVILGDEELTVTTSANIIKVLPTEYIEALLEQQVDMNRIADCVAERINENVLESEEESI
ncbi:hypothetical protein [[Eubacterium] hominis]|uniref:hypothetical protein n=1 Tax=[Eubacterium] hominis TaxID=2764325 RepID=UPI003A4D492F